MYTMIRICCYCKKVLGLKKCLKEEDHGKHTHGICEECEKVQSKKIKDYLMRGGHVEDEE